MMFLPNIKNYHVILASASPRRQQLLSGMDIAFEVLLKEVEEDFPNDMPLEEIAGFLSQRKSVAYSDDELPDNYLLITADTIVIADGKVLNKPSDDAEARSMIGQLSGKTHFVVTGVCIRTKEKTVLFSEKSAVTFGQLDAQEIDWLCSYPVCTRIVLQCYGASHTPVIPGIKSNLKFVL
jgi:septum formation protein